MLKNFAAAAITVLALLGVTAGIALSAPAAGDGVPVALHRTSPVH
ncbi:hypothetical protein [Lentzea aerocolonigenes]|nr:hypothetical protein [Lentzea aerocolonigenes]